MKGQISVRIGKLEERHRPMPLLLSKATRDARVRAALSDPEQIASLMAHLLTDPSQMPMPHVVASAMRADT